ncbi:MAG: NUDIX domain-containing protein [Saprospiraceae bacterium]|nr:NUDIX domain-containing protein [Saprospiraceae bacterium]
MSKRRQIYEIQINEHCLVLRGKHELEQMEIAKQRIVMPYQGNKKTLFQYLDMLEKSNRFEEVVLESVDPSLIFKDLKSICNWVPAAGGIISRADGKILMIFRKKIWDLPKGKVDPGEKSKQTALRECMEEVGLSDLELIRKLGLTWHLYREFNKSRALKRTKWYVLKTSTPDKLVLQSEEGIERAEWLDVKDALLLEPMYSNIKQMLLKYEDLVEGLSLKVKA